LDPKYSTCELLTAVGPPGVLLRETRRTHDYVEETDWEPDWAPEEENRPQL
jgi:hypothetical protein